MAGLGRHYEIDVTCRGEADPVVGYLVDIKDVDRAVRTAAVPIIERACRENPHEHPVRLLPGVLAAVEGVLGFRTHAVMWRLSPYHCVEMSAAARDIAIIRHQFDFSASHRLHVASMSDEENRATFGKCNNPSGHGHNYRLELAIEVASAGAKGSSPGPRIEDIERLVGDTVIARFDHKYLNVDTEEFGPHGLIPSVENIARVCFELLEPAVRMSFGGASVRGVTVWETDRTSATFPAR